MKIQQIILDNFRVYQGEQQITFDTSSSTKNITLISGKNGFGKTSFLTSLVWCLYGKLIADVDDKYRTEIADAGGYGNYCRNIYNQKSKSYNFGEISKIKANLEIVAPSVKRDLKKKIENLQSFSVKIILTDVYLPSFPCKTISIKRIHNIAKDSEVVEILIDGQENELSKEVGPEIFINDFLLPKEIAKFFFFDAEKIVSLAETKTADEKRKLSEAYSEVLGIRKYLDLKTNLENMRTRLARQTAHGVDKEKLDGLQYQVEIVKKSIRLHEKEIDDLAEEIQFKKKKSNEYQGKLIREGTTVTLEEYNLLKARKKELSASEQELKELVKDMIDLAPFAIASNLMEKVRVQLEHEKSNSVHDLLPKYLQSKIDRFKLELKKVEFNAEQVRWIAQLMDKHLYPDEISPDFKPLLEFKPEDANRFQAVYDNLKGSYRITFDNLSKDYKFIHGQLNTVTKQLNHAESKEKDTIINEIRTEKQLLDQEILNKEKALIDHKVKLVQATNDFNSLEKQLSEVTKKIYLGEKQRLKDETTSRLIQELENFIHQLRFSKKVSLEERLKSILNTLMHKSDFVSRIHVIIEGDVIDIELYDKEDQIIRKEGLSKGEQQLYATAMLKALVDESSIKFPVFIDSPLQKLDKEHAKNIIQHFYPEASEQVILFPLLGKELSLEEYKWLKPNISDVYLIQNTNQSSQFKSVEPDDLDHYIHETVNYV